MSCPRQLASAVGCRYQAAVATGSAVAMLFMAPHRKWRCLGIDWFEGECYVSRNARTCSESHLMLLGFIEERLGPKGHEALAKGCQGDMSSEVGVIHTNGTYICLRLGVGVDVHPPSMCTIAYFIIHMMITSMFVEMERSALSIEK
ncbi:hypothetical protein VOLCADRAFT_92059 [Volvox carteri f. nagariensis]|uniref:Uncharacterized protein n=1 Tax=Volvox carteri f. nagariensis TaxID=3068 RepID=D8TZ03_VOLCA|nr:uncharacterized protein VOLCADRAFT_92059 [Volvox carteri f. nagariensis]EFJ47311.1 hypothetical protein VOLCADRAFT_92059 [Volvox carteri f. nagariensis]|eukprot:XP_002951500.1 hypothetical protein VOLCADRAFT_92059 [Volvox carteri f. nagariensis]